MSKAQAIQSAPYGGLVATPWAVDEIYGVSANWANASSPVWVLGADNEWEQSPWQVADFRHSPEAALEWVLADALRQSGDDTDEAKALAQEAEEFEAEVAR